MESLFRRIFGTEDENVGHWDIVYGNDIVLHEVRALLNWRMNDYISVWSSTGYKNYAITTSNIVDQIPYFPEFDFDLTIKALTGYGIELMLNGQYIGERFTSQVKDNDVLESYFIGSLFVSKKIGENFEIYGQLNNLFNTDYEIWKGYSAPQFNGWGGIKVLW